MGIDIEMKVRTREPLTDAAIEELTGAFQSEFGIEFEPGSRPPYPSFDRDKWHEGEGHVIELQTLGRYYGPGYERGDWPRIKAKGDWLMVRFGETAEVRYGGDSADDWAYLVDWTEARVEYEKHWQEVGHLPYRSYFGGGCDCEHCIALTPMNGRTDDP